ncbi:LOW QUALITY PROTEIN: Polyprotein [Phytophthora palmivora]|uniref:Polyprotein n=1 Tax=Phytophthora palmivora TaxID=4796 RepID=A0A2P4XGF1_9STRA|nr:LOW QUALITY PROTEIN: Polyprotein [Phytophthora palmivora]
MFQMRDCIVTPTPQAKSVDLEKEETLNPGQIEAQPFDCRDLLETLDLTLLTQSDNQYLACYNTTHWRAAQRVLKYLKGTSTNNIEYNGNSTAKVELYTDTSFANANEGRKFVTGFVSILAGACITWTSVKQNCIILNTAELELVTAREGVTVIRYQSNAIIDNTAAISIIKDPCSHSSTKHIDIRHLHVRDTHEDKQISVMYFSTNDILADALTNPLRQPQFEKLRAMMAVKNLKL